MKHIKDSLPQLKSKVASLLEENQKELLSLGDPRLNQSKVRELNFARFLPN